MTLEYKNIDVQVKTKVSNLIIGNVNLRIEPFIADSGGCVSIQKNSDPLEHKTFDDLDLEINKLLECASYLKIEIDQNIVRDEIEQVKQSSADLFTIVSR